MKRSSLPAESRLGTPVIASLAPLVCSFALLSLIEPMRNGEAGLLTLLRGIGPEDTGWVLLLIGLLVVGNAWTLDALLEQVTRREGRTRAGARVLRLCIAGIPLLGLYTIPLWLSLLDRLPHWAIAPLTSTPPPSYRRFLAFFTSRLQWMRITVWWLVSLLGLNVLLWLPVVAWLANSRLEFLGTPLIDQVVRLLHVVLFASAFTFVVLQRRAIATSWFPRPLVWAFPALWLLPFPWCMAGVGTLVVFDFRRGVSLVEGAFEGRRSGRSHLMELGQFQWWKLSLWQRFPWRSGRSPGTPADAEVRIARLCGLKTFLLFPEVALATALLVAIPGLEPLLGLGFYGALLTIVLSGIVLAFSFLRHRRSGGAPPVALPRVLLSASAACAGLYAGAPLGRGQIDQLGNALLLIGYVGMFASMAFALPVRPGAGRFRLRKLLLVAWVLVYAAIGLTGARLLEADNTAPRLDLILLLLCLVPLASLALGALSFSWLLHPWTFQHIHEQRLPLRLRLALVFLAVTAWAPGGGFAVPLWAAARRHLWPGAMTPQPRTFEPPPLPRVDSQRPSIPSGRRNYIVHHAIAHQVENGSAETLFRQIETHPFLADQATFSGGFRRGSEDLEEHILPLTLRRGDWERFLRYSALAVNLRKIADDLAEPDLLPALVQNGHRVLAFDAAARVVDPAERALARATLAASLETGENDRASMLELVRSDLASLAPAETSEEAETRALALIQIGLRLGPEIFPSLQEIPPPPEGWEPRPGLLAMSAAVGGLRHRDGLDEPSWQILRDLGEEKVIAQFLPDVLETTAANYEPARLLHLVSTLSVGPEGLWACRLGILSRQARTSPEEACLSWQSLPAEPSPPWSVPLIERGASLLAVLPEAEIEHREKQIEDPNVRAALRVALLERRPDDATDRAARAAIERLPEGTERLHWMLRLTASSPMSEEDRRKEIRAIGRQLFTRKYQAPQDDLRLYLELVAGRLPEEMPRRAEDAILSPGGGPPLLFHLAGSSDSRDLLEHVFAQAESYLSVLWGIPELEQLRLWRELMPELTGRLCLLREDLTALKEAADKLGEIDPLVVRVTAVLADAGREELAAEACARIRSDRLRLATRLRRLPGTVLASGELEPEPLYRALASVAPLNDEWLGLAALHDPDPPEIAFQRHVEPIGDGDTRVLATFRLAWKALEKPQPQQRTARLVLQMLGQALANLQSDARLVALTPWLPALAARADPGLLLAESREAFARLINLQTVPWSVRRDAIERLLVSLGTCPAQRASKLFAELEAILMDGIPGEDETEAADLLPMLTAGWERLPGAVAEPRDNPPGSRLRFVEAESEQIRMLCLDSADKRARRLAEWPPSEISSRIAQALSYLLLARQAERTPALVATWPAGPWRDNLCRRLASHGWVTGGTASELTRNIENAAMVKAAGLLVETRNQGGENRRRWLGQVASQVAEGEVDLSDPTWASLFAEIWASDPQQSREALAEAVLAALGNGAPQTAEIALRLWLHAHLSPKESDLPSNACDRARSAIRGALVLSSGAA